MEHSPYEDPEERLEVVAEPVGRRIPTATLAYTTCKSHTLQKQTTRGPTVWSVRQVIEVCATKRFFQALCGDTRTNNSSPQCTLKVHCGEESHQEYPKDQGEAGRQTRVGQFISARARANASTLAAPWRLATASCALS
ncbi:hypothetical protein FA13DRAFT_1736334 [Coprinellus micaceus]|uniref:Uncharacterized protein n=1 Tax=Coprinellus micaceus TaxID=71717 RepID=A0A4Y7T042_COPMI|nr:hypothetical protein FA13DRAFT_1736334 [Coprinellus micaceus]